MRASLTMIGYTIGLAMAWFMYPVQANEALASKYNCLICHAVDKKVTGPAYKDVAAKYKGDPHAIETLVQKVKNGGTGVWGNIPMPANSSVPDEDLKTLIQWILSLQ